MAPDDDKKRTRSPSYPFIDLKDAIHYAKLAYDEEDRHPFTPEAAAAHWDYKATSSAVSQVISALKQFGLITDEPGNGSRRVRLSSLALDLMVHEDESNPRRRELLQTAALNPKIHREIWSKYGGKLPSVTSLKIYLLREREGAPFNKDHVDKFISQLLETIEFAKLTESDKLPPADDAAAEGDDHRDEGDGGQRPSRMPARRPMQTGTKEATLPLTTGQIIVQWPEQINPDEMEDAQGWMEVIVRMMKRSVSGSKVKYSDPKEVAKQRHQLHEQEGDDGSDGEEQDH
jgi:hypothetical protein